MKHKKQTETALNEPLYKHPSINVRADWFSKQFANAHYEMGEAQKFVNGLCDVYQVEKYRDVLFEARVKKEGGAGINRIDALFRGLLLIEMKSEGKSLEDAYTQALDYIDMLADYDKPQHVLVSDFKHLHLYTLTGNRKNDARLKPDPIKLADFRQHYEKLSFLQGYESVYEDIQETINVKAAELLGDLHDAIKATGYKGRQLEILLARLLFCLFAEDTKLFDRGASFRELIKKDTFADGTHLGSILDALFDTLNKDERKRSKSLSPRLKLFPYVNGSLFAERLELCYFNGEIRTSLLTAANFDWSEISPDIFGNLFQYIIHYHQEEANQKGGKRREFGAHYTSERNIGKVIDSLFLDDLKAEFFACGKNKNKLNNFCKKLENINFLDPACGCGNFLIVAYREIRLLELAAVEKIFGKDPVLDIKGFIKCNVHQFYGIEIDESAVHIATIALWLTDHQMNRMAEKRLGNYFKRLPLNEKPNIIHANALREGRKGFDWSSVIPAEKCSYILGNPPFVGKQFQTDKQKKDMEMVTKGIAGAGVLDYVSAWYIKASQYIQSNPAIPVGFVSTNSITQGEQVSVLWKPLMAMGININFAHRTFRWSNEGKGIAAVHCVIVGFGLMSAAKKRIFDYDDIHGEAKKPQVAKTINPYLVDAPLVVITNRREAICAIPPIVFGNMPNDGGHLLLSDDEKIALLKNEPLAKKWIRPFLGADEFINNHKRWCLWLLGITAKELEAMPAVAERVNAVEATRLASKRQTTRELAACPHLFGEIRHPQKGHYLLIPGVSSEKRQFIPIGFLDSNTIASNATLIVPHATIYHFGMLTSTMHNAWMRAVCGRLESRYRYSNGIVYNNYPWVEDIAEQQKMAIERAAQKVLDTRGRYQEKSLAWLYNTETMPKDLRTAHHELDQAVDKAYRYTSDEADAPRVAFLLALYSKRINKDGGVKAIKAIKGDATLGL